MKPRIIFVVGHAGWGKSETLIALTKDTNSITINKIDYFVRRMSNDDQPDGLVAFAKKLDPDKKPNVIATLCPNFIDSDRYTHDILGAIKAKGYQIHFWVILNRAKPSKNGKNNIEPKEITELRSYGKVKVYDEGGLPKTHAHNLRTYIETL